MICDICMYESYTYAVMHFESHAYNQFCNIFFGIRIVLVLLCKHNTKWGGWFLAPFWCKNGIRAAPKHIAFGGRRWSIWVDFFCFGTVCDTAITRYAREIWRKEAITCICNSPIMRNLIRPLIRFNQAFHLILIRLNQAFHLILIRILFFNQVECLILIRKQPGGLPD